MDISTILNIPGFLFFCLIFSVGYFFMEVVVGEVPWFHSIIKRNNGSSIDRIMHYIFWGILINFGFIIFAHFHQDTTNWLIGLFNWSGDMGKGVETIFPWVEAKDAQIVIFSVYYVFELIMIWFIWKLIWWICNFIEWMIEKIDEWKKWQKNWEKRKS